MENNINRWNTFRKRRLQAIDSYVLVKIVFKSVSASNMRAINALELEWKNGEGKKTKGI
jgi:hypothetical protein